MKLSSSAFNHKGAIPAEHTCSGADINPELVIEEVPIGAASLTLIVDDPDAPGGDWVHWLVWNMPAATRGIGEGSIPDGVQGTTSFGSAEYGGPCPPSGTHHYHFKLYALDTIVELDSTAQKEELEQAMDGYVLAEAELIGTYSRG